MDTGACYGMKKCAEVSCNAGKVMKGEELRIVEEKIKSIYQERNQSYKFLGRE